MKRFCPAGLLILGAVLGAAEAAVAEVDYDHRPITCEFMRRHPAKVFSRPADLGDPISAWAYEDYRCAESLGRLPFLSRLARLAEVSHGEESRECNGTHIYPEERQYLFALLKAGLAPDLFLREAEKAEKQEHGLYSHQLQYFAAWSQGSFSNFRLHREFLAEYDRALPKLAAHYRQKLGFSEAKARAAARYALRLFVQRAAGDFSAEDLSAPVPRLVQLSESPRSTVADVRGVLAAQPAPGQETVDQAFKAALLHGKPRPYLALLAEKLTTLEEGDEPAIFFALGDADNVKWLLDRGARVDPANGFGKTPLFYAIGLGDLALVKLLLDHGADVNHPYKTAAQLEPNPEAVGESCSAYRFIRHAERTPLMHAAQRSDVAMLKLLLARGARLADVDGAASNALDYARMGHRAANAALLSGLGLHPHEGRPAHPRRSRPPIHAW
jgi:hypothetical protein